MTRIQPDRVDTLAWPTTSDIHRRLKWAKRRGDERRALAYRVAILARAKRAQRDA